LTQRHLRPRFPPSQNRILTRDTVVPNIRSAKKRMRQNAKERGLNRQQRATLRTAVKRVRSAQSAAEAAAALHEAEALLDRAARKRLIHPNAAARQKHRLAKATKAK